MASDNLWAHTYQVVTTQNVPLLSVPISIISDKEHNWMKLSNVTILGEKVHVWRKNDTPSGTT